MKLLLSNKKIVRVLIIISVLLIIAAYFGYNKLFGEITDLITEKNDQLFIEYSQNNAYSTSLELNNTLALMKTSSNIFSDVDDFTSDDTLIKLRLIELDSPIKPIRISDSNGKAVDSQGQIYNISSKEYFNRSILGESGVYTDDGKNIVLSTPIIKNGKAIGTLSADYDIFALSKLVETQNLDGESYSIIINQKGDILLNSKKEKSIIPKDLNFLDFLSSADFTSSTYEQVRSNVQSLTSGKGSLSYKGHSNYFYYTPIGVNNWILFKYITQDYLDSTIQPVKQHASYLAIIVSILCVSMGSIVIISIILVNKRKNAQLMKAYAAAEHANSAKSMFLSKMSHEIRTPMNAIAGLTQICQNNADDPEKVISCLNKIDQSSKILLNIINDILDMSAIENNKMKIAHNPFNIIEVLNTIAAVYFPQCKQKKVKFNVVAIYLPYENLIGDQLRINQILLNLISNAYKFTPSGGEILVKASEKVQEDKVLLELQVKDTGEGMSQEMQERLFKPFEQESADTAQKHGGSGLGLSIVKNLCELMNGEITVKSEKGKGTVFNVTLPLEYVNNEDVIDKDTYKDLKVLIADSEKSAAEYLAYMLANMGIYSDYAIDFTSAKNFLEQTENGGQKYDLAFIDRSMSSPEGKPLGKVIREKYNYDKDKPLIITYTDDIASDKNLYDELGVDKILEKPVFQSSLYNLIISIYPNLSKQKSTLEDFDFSGKKVLLAEDNAMNVEIATEFLKMVNMKVDVAQNGQIAVDKFNSSGEYEYDAILMDMQMPVMNGIEAAKTIRAGDHPRSKIIPILAMTANSYSEDISACLDAGMNAHIAKPIDTNILYQTLKDAIK